MQNGDKKEETAGGDALADRIADATNSETLTDLESEEKTTKGSGSSEELPSPDANPIAGPDHKDDAGPM